MKVRQSKKRDLNLNDIFNLVSKNSSITNVMDYVDTGIENVVGKEKVKLNIGKYKQIKKVICNYQQKQEKEVNTILMTEKEYEVNNNNRINDQVGAMLNLSMCDNDNTREMLYSIVSDFYQVKLDDSSDKEVWFNQHVQLPSFNFSTWLTIICFNKIEKMYNHYLELYNLILNKKIKDFDFNEHLEEIGIVDVINENSIIYDIKNDLLGVVFNKKCVFFKFKKLALNVHKSQTPGFSTLYDKFEKSKFLKEKTIKKLDVIQLENEFRINNNSDNILYYASKVAAYLGTSVGQYLSLLSQINMKVIYDEETKKYCYINDFNKADVLPISYIQITSNTPYTTHFNIQGTQITNIDKVHVSYLFLNDTDYETFEQFGVKNKDKKIVYYLFSLYIALNNFGQPVQITSDAQDTYVEKTKLIFEPEHKKNEIYTKTKHGYLDYDNNIDKDSFFPFENQTKKGKIISQDEIVRVNNEDLIKKDKEKILKDNFKIVDKYIQEMKISKISENKIRFISLFYSYSNRTTFQCANVRVRTVLNIINNNKKYSSFLDIVLARYGTSNNILCSLFIFWVNTKLTNGGNLLVKNSGIYYVKERYWLFVCKQITEIAKTNNLYNNVELTFTDFKNLQYMENFIGPLGSDGKTAIQSISQRVYVQHRKMIIKQFGLEHKLDNYELSNKVCYLVCKLYWKKVLKKSRKEFKGIIFNLNNRELFTTDAGSGGLKDMFESKLIQDKISSFDKNFKAKQRTKKSAFQSESNFWFQRVIFDLPMTLCDMILKKKENGKLRYIYSVGSAHYLMSSCLTLELEENMNQLGMINVLDESNVITHNYNKKIGIENCTDYAEFNDQHQEEHKQIIWHALRDVVIENDYYKETKEEFCFLCNWMALACEKMFLRLDSDSSILYEAKGRLFSGERATGSTNGILNKVYGTIVDINYILYKKEDNKEAFNEIKKILNDELILDDKTLLYKRMIKNECLGDDGRTRVNSLTQASLLNEITILSGFMLKLNKCLIGIGFSEFLRKVETSSEKKMTISMGYSNRSIASLVCGNPEGSNDRVYIQLITQVYEALQNIRIRSGCGDLNDELLLESWKWISTFNQKGKERKLGPIDAEILYIPKNQGGFGFFKTDGSYFKLKNSLGKLPVPDIEVSKEFRKFRTTAIETKIAEVDVPSVLEYGDMDVEGLASRINEDREEFFKSRNLTGILYSDIFFVAAEKYIQELRKSIKNGSWVEEKLDEDKKMSFEEFIQYSQVVKSYFGTKMVLQKETITKVTQKISGFRRNLTLVKVKKSDYDKLCIRRFGLYNFTLYKLENEFFNHTMINRFIEPNIYNTILSHFYVALGRNLNLDAIRYFLDDYIYYNMKEKI